MSSVTMSSVSQCPVFSMTNVFQSVHYHQPSDSHHAMLSSHYLCILNADSDKAALLLLHIARSNQVQTGWQHNDKC